MKKLAKLLFLITVIGMVVVSCDLGDDELNDLRVIDEASLDVRADGNEGGSGGNNPPPGGD